MSEPRTMTLGAYQDAIRSYDEMYEAGLTTQACTNCGKPVIERDACWDFYPGSGTILHKHCRGGYWYAYEAPTWFGMAMFDYLKNVEDRHAQMGHDGAPHGDTRSYAALLERNRREHPGDPFFDRPPDAWKWPGYYEVAMRGSGLCSWQNGVPW